MPRPPSSHSSHSSISSAVSATAQAAKKALTKMKSAAKAVLRPNKKARIGDGNSDQDDTEPEDDQAELARLQATWCSPVYNFFKPKVDVVYEGKCKAHVFYCAAKRCKGKDSVHHYQDSQDRAATSNLKTHTIKCFGQDVVQATFDKDDSTISQDSSIFAAFAQSNRPMNVINDWQFKTLMQAGRPGTSLLSPTTVSRDIKAAFEACRVQIDKILK
ncbi:hypothetical protein H0H92_005884, partial [Tricholoma furcatifolium]